MIRIYVYHLLKVYIEPDAQDSNSVIPHSKFERYILFIFIELFATSLYYSCILYSFLDQIFFQKISSIFKAACWDLQGLSNVSVVSSVNCVIKMLIFPSILLFLTYSGKEDGIPTRGKT